LAIAVFMNTSFAVSSSENHMSVSAPAVFLAK
jgi:hypothetical protein